MTYGLVPLLYNGPAIGYTNIFASPQDAHLIKEYVFDYFGPDAIGVRPDLCGAPVVHEKSQNEELDGLVLGFVSSKSGRDCIVESLDEVIDSGWDLAKTNVHFPHST